MNLMGKPVEQKPEPRRADPKYLSAVRRLPCCACGVVGRTEAHHCRDAPAFDERHLYDSLPAAGRKSADRDAIPLCGPDGCHAAFHLDRKTFHLQFGRDYYYIAVSRNAVENGNGDY